MQKTQSQFFIFALFAFIILTWGFGWPVTKIGLEYASPVWYTCVRLIMGTAVMFVLVIALGKCSLPQKRDWPLILIIAILQVSGYILLSNIGLKYVPAGRASILGYTTPVFVLPMAILFFKEKASKMHWLGFLLGMIGILLLLSPWQINWTDTKVLFGSAMLLLAAFGWAVSIMATRYMTWHKSPLELMPWQLLVGTLPILISALIKEPHPIIHWTLPFWLSLIYTGFLVTGISYWCGIVVNRALPTIVVSLGLLASPVCSLLISVIFMGEKLSLTTTCAMISILLGLICLILK